MSTEKELTIKLLEAKIERLTGKKVTYTEKADPAKAKKKADTLKALKEMAEAGEVAQEELDEIFGKLGQKVSNFMNSGMQPAQAEQTYATTYAKQYPSFQKFFPTEAAFKAVVVAYLQKYGMMTPSSTIFDPNAKQFVKKAGVTGGSNGGTSFSESKKTTKPVVKPTTKPAAKPAVKK